MSPDVLPPARCDFSHARKGNGLFKEKPSTKVIFPFSRGKDRISQGVEDRGSLISVPLALRECGKSAFQPGIRKSMVPIKFPPVIGRRTNVQQLTCNIGLSNSFYYLFFFFVLIELKPFVLNGKSRGKNHEQVRKSVKNYETILPFSCCPLVFSLSNSGAGNGCANFMGAWHFLVSFCWKTPMPIKFLLGGGGSWVF